jgi:hypothetical protein
MLSGEEANIIFIMPPSLMIKILRELPSMEIGARVKHVNIVRRIFDLLHDNIFDCRKIFRR